MSNFKPYWLSIPTCRRADFAAECFTTSNYLNMIAHGQKNPSETLAVNIEIASKGYITVADLLPEFAERLARAGYKKRKGQ